MAQDLKTGESTPPTVYLKEPTPTTWHAADGSFYMASGALQNLVKKYPLHTGVVAKWPGCMKHRNTS